MKNAISFAGVLLLAIAIVFGIYSFYPNQKYCISVNDCSCGVSTETGECFYGNNEFVDESSQCPDFCTGIDGRIEIICENNECVQKRLAMPGEYCEINSDCKTPMEFIIQSNCPFGAACINNTCKVVCPLFYHDPNIDISRSYSFTCETNSDCDCSERGSRTIECLCVENSCVSIEA